MYRRTSSRRRWSLLAGLLAVGVVLAGCAGGTEEAAGGAGATVTHKYGSTQVPANPKRVVTVGLTDQDTVLALGVKPVALKEWFAEGPYATGPWAQDELGNAKPKVLTGEELNFEQIATMRPDVILGINSGMTKKEYDTLSEIAPTVAQSGEFVNFGTPWQEQTRTIGRALGRTEQAERRITEVENKFAEVRRNHPEFQGKVGMMGITSSDGNYFIWQSQDGRGRFLSALGFKIPKQIDQLAGDESFFATVSRERLDIMGDAGAFVWVTNSAEEESTLRDDQLYKKLAVSRQGRDIFLPTDEAIAGALSYNNVLSLPFALDKLTPMLRAAADGDPATKVSAE